MWVKSDIPFERIRVPVRQTNIHGQIDGKHPEKDFVQIDLNCYFDEATFGGIKWYIPSVD